MQLGGTIRVSTTLSAKAEASILQKSGSFYFGLTRIQDRIKQALHFLNKAGITYQCFHTAAQSYPLGAEVDEKKFKVFF